MSLEISFKLQHHLIQEIMYDGRTLELRQCSSIKTTVNTPNNSNLTRTCELCTSDLNLAKFASCVISNYGKEKLESGFQKSTVEHHILLRF